LSIAWSRLRMGSASRSRSTRSIHERFIAVIGTNGGSMFPPVDNFAEIGR
jgi:hypothetical protein